MTDVAGKIKNDIAYTPFQAPPEQLPIGAKPQYHCRYYREFDNTGFFTKTPVLTVVGADDVRDAIKQMEGRELGDVLEGFGKITRLKFDAVAYQPMPIAA